jgi:hypothetical protein
MFPHGMPGVALVFLRASVALHLLQLHAPLAQLIGTGLACGSLPPMIALLLVGYCTPVTAAIAALLGLSALMVAMDLATAIAITSACALALIGPGAFSLDARRFGRRRWRAPAERRDR